MKIGILTHPLLGNYGGMIQAYALVKILRNLGHDARNLAFLPLPLPNFWRAPIQHLRQRLQLGERLRVFRLMCSPAPAGTKVPRILNIMHGCRFQHQYVPYCRIGDSPTDQLIEHGIEAIVVGSDQVWRDIYARSMKSLPFFFLDFAPEEIRCRSIAYAASFGSDTWGGTDGETEICRSLLQDFKAVSVRESSGVNICRNIFEKEALHVLDPTMLLDAEDYDTLIASKPGRDTEAPFICTYLLDQTSEISDAVSCISRKLNLPLEPLQAEPQFARKKHRFPISVARWLRGIRHCQYLITDSFHGCVFAIIFNKPFVCLGNKDRGAARFESLLSTFGLQDRLVIKQNAEAIQQILNTRVDWDKVNAIRQKERERALHFLKENLR